ncbi:alpha/beta fold hydrolase [Rhodococcus sp. ABRD24]|uniref:alpha/beta fold hydrolase n=1 Tax=Rhodococcus sp. ABRD24 TaxID=2507582 RepID=UPI00103BCCD9|nr:alpha/beta fold hydrolase [Rhodococcus sp. ABRD24]QBJ98295.1 alpha/beta fold hydrolase [Rhodococcus sp. ABRD24]
MRRIGVLAIVLAVCTACGAGPSERPDVAVVEQGGDPAPTSDGPPAIASLQAPVRDLVWKDCKAATLDRLELGPGPGGLSLECSSFVAPVDATSTAAGSLEVGVLRARLPQTPTDAAPLVLTSGSDLASSSTLAALATGPISALLATRPIVAVDRRGIGTSTAIDCVPTPDRRVLADLGEFGPADIPDASKVAAASRAATIACTDDLAPDALAFDTAHAADDLEQLRRIWQVDSLGLLGSGNGAAVALAYAARHPAQVGRLVLDSPAATTADASTAAEYRVQGAQAAVAAFSRRCAALSCSLGPDPAAAITDLHGRAAAGELAPVSSNALLTAVSAFLGSPRGDQSSRVRELSDILAAAGRGDKAPLLDLIGATEAAVGSDGQFVARCSDGQQWPGPGQAGELAQAWSQRYPLFGSDAAIALMSCSAWPTMAPPPLPSKIPAPTLVLSGVADPIVGDGGLSTVTGTLAAAGTVWSSVSWEGSGHPVTTHSDCAQQALIRYIDAGTLPPNGGACPA